MSAEKIRITVTDNRENPERKSPAHPKFGVATPLANEEKTIEGFLDRVLAHLEPGDRVYCVLDNVCKDRTRAMVSERAARDPRVVLVWSPQNRCVVDAYFAGYRAAYDDGCEWILEMDGGLSHLPEQIPQFLEAMSRGYDYVGGSRQMPGGRHESPWNRVVVSRGGTFLARLLLKAKMTDMTSGFECFNRRAMGLVLQRGVASKANFFQTEIRFMMHDLRWMEVPITYHNTNHRIGRSSIREAFRNLWRMRRAEARKRRNT
jgi:dolichol-phosphate mannosyltransferase